MNAARFSIRYRFLTVGGSLSAMVRPRLAAEWKKAKAARARFEQDVGLPVRSCRADMTPRAYRMRGNGNIAHLMVG